MFKNTWYSVQATLWDIWSRNRTAMTWMFGLTLLGALVTLLVRLIAPDSIQAEGPLRSLFLNFVLIAAGAAFLLAFAAFGYAEFNSLENASGFPRRLFTLPVTSLQLVAVPVASGIASIELIYWIWIRYVIDANVQVGVYAALFAVYIVFCQVVSWTLGRLGPLRLAFVAVVAFVLQAFAIRATFPGSAFTERSVILLFLALTAALFFVAWISVSQQRIGAGSRVRIFSSATEISRALVDRTGKWLPVRQKPFASGVEAQTWFEWKRSGYVLPLLVGAFLVGVIGPVSWHEREDPAATLRILAAVLALPIVLALPVGKAFSKPDFWSGDLSLPAMLSVRPLSTEDIVAIKLRVAFRSAIRSWALVISFLGAWLSLWANTDLLHQIRIGIWQLSGHHSYLAYELIALSVVAGLFLTWKFMVSSLWLGLAGNSRLFSASAIPYAVVPFFVLAALLFLARHDQSAYAWLRHRLNGLLPGWEWTLAVILIAKCWLSVWSWRHADNRQIRRYLPFWTLGTFVLLLLGTQLAGPLQFFVPADIYRIRNLLILFVMLLMPLARIGLAPSSLARNRHR